MFSVSKEMTSALSSVYIGPPSQVTTPAHLVPIRTRACSAYRITCVCVSLSPGPHPDEECYLVTMPREHSAALLIGRAGGHFPKSVSIFRLEKNN